MGKIRNHKQLAFVLAAVLFTLQLVSSAGIGQRESVKAATGPQDTSTIVVSGSAVTVDPGIVMSAVNAVEITKNSITYQWAPVANATSYYIYKYDIPKESYEYYGATSDKEDYLLAIPRGGTAGR